jgi:glucokinase
MEGLVLAADLGGTNLRMAAVDHGGSFSHLIKRRVPPNVSPPELIELIRTLAAEISASPRALAFTAPAPVPFDFDGVLTKLPNLSSVTGMNLKRALEDEFGLPVVIENDATAAAIGETWIGASRGISNSITVTLGTGIGGGIIIDGKPHRGPDGIGGEIGHITVEPNGRRCKCGSIGCVEEYASATAIARIAQEHGMKTRDSAEVYAAWMGGDATAAIVFTEMGRYLGIMLASLANAINPEMLVICGGASAAWEAFAPSTQAEISSRAYPRAASRARLVKGILGDNAGLLGVARSAFLELAGERV